MNIRALPCFLACSFTLAGFAIGEVKTFQPGSGSWSTGSNWDPVGVPTEADRVVIPDDTVCNINTTAHADTLEIEAGGTLNILSDQSLSLDNDNNNVGGGDPDNSIIDGILFITGGDDPGIFYTYQQSHWISGDGRIQGEDVNALVEIGAGTTLTNLLDTVGEGFYGGMTIKGRAGIGEPNGEFANEGRVDANNRLTIVLDSTTILDDVEGAWWGISYNNSRIEFRREALNLEGDIETGGCTTTFLLIFKADVKTCGELIYNYAGIDIQNSSTFEYATFSGTQPNPGTAMKSPTDCETPWVCTEDDMGAGCG